MENPKEVAFMKDGELYITQEAKQALYQGTGGKVAESIMNKIINGNPALKPHEKQNF